MQYIFEFDLFRQPVQLCLNNQYVHKTKIGSFFSICLVGIVLILSYQEINDMVYGLNPTLVTQEIIPNTPSYYKLTPKNYMLNFGMQDANSLQWKNDSIVTIQMIQFSRSQTDESLFDEYQVPLKTCTKQDIEIDDLKSYMKAFDLTKMYCIDHSKVTQEIGFEGQWADSEFKYFQIRLLQCQNTTDSQNCAPQEDINNALNFANFFWETSDIYVDATNYDNPIKIIGLDSFTQVSINSFKNIDNYLEPIQIETDYGYITQDLITLNAFKFNSQVSQISLTQNTQTFLIMGFRSYNRNYICKRSYIKLQQILGTLGGVWNLLFIFIQVVVSRINFLSQRIVLLNQLFNFEGYNEFKPKNLSKANGDKINIEEKQNVEGDIVFPVDYLQLKHIMLHLKQKTSGIVLKFCDIIQIILNCCYISRENRKKIQQLIFAENHVKQLLDLSYIIQKLNEIDKLKMIILTPEQIQLFDIIDKPTISQYPFQQNTQHNEKYWSLLKEKSVSYYSDAIATQDAFNILKYQDNLTNKMLFKMLDKSLQQILLGNDENSILKDVQSNIISPKYQSNSEMLEDVQSDINSPKNQADGQINIKQELKKKSKDDNYNEKQFELGQVIGSDDQSNFDLGNIIGSKQSSIIMKNMFSQSQYQKKR